MRHFATESRKSKGQFYTPAEVSRIVANIIGIKTVASQDKTILKVVQQKIEIIKIFCRTHVMQG